MKVLVTGSAGFIGFWLTRSLGIKGIETVGIDNINSSYDPAYKLRRLAENGIPKKGALSGKIIRSDKYRSLSFLRMDIADHEGIMCLMEQERPTHVVNLAAQPGVRYSIDHPFDYIHSNIDGFVSMLEGIRKYPVEHFVYASSSSVYGVNSKIPFSETDAVEQPESLYAATKRSDELIAHVYNRLYGIRATGLRFFTVYGPWGRPDMAPMLFADAIMKGNPIKVFNHGDMRRDFTYIADIVQGIEKVLFSPPGTEKQPVYNIGHGSPVKLMEFIGNLEQILGKEAKKEYLPMQPGDVPITYADVKSLKRDFGYEAETPLGDGLREFAEWLAKERQ